MREARATSPASRSGRAVLSRRSRAPRGPSRARTWDRRGSWVGLRDRPRRGERLGRCDGRPRVDRRGHQRHRAEPQQPVPVRAADRRCPGDPRVPCTGGRTPHAPRGDRRPPEWDPGPRSVLNLTATPEAPRKSRRHTVGAQHAAPLLIHITRREGDSMTTHRSGLVGTAIVAGLTAAIRRPAPALGAGGTPAPELTNTSWLNSDKPLRIADLRGRVVLLNFWVFTCGNCTRTVPSLVAYDRLYP